MKANPSIWYARIGCMKYKKEPFNHGRHFECDECLFKERPIVIVGSRKFSTDLLTHYIQCNKPAPTSSVKRLEDVPLPGPLPQNEWRLIFLDCQGLNGDAITQMLKTEGARYLQHDIIALFNLSRDDVDISTLIDLGARGFFFETDQPDVLLKGICALKFGEMWVTRGVLMEYISRKPKQVPPPDQAGPHLSRREIDILLQLSSGASNEEISARLFISLHTVKTHISHICKKLDVRNRMQAALWAAKHLH